MEEPLSVFSRSGERERARVSAGYIVPDDSSEGAPVSTGMRTRPLAETGATYVRVPPLSVLRSGR